MVRLRTPATPTDMTTESQRKPTQRVRLQYKSAPSGMYNPMLLSRSGTPEWWSMAKFAWHWKVRRDVTTLRGLVGGILEERRGLGIMAVLMVEAAKAAGIADDVVVIGYDALPEALQQVQSGELYGTVEQFPGVQARTGLRTLVEFIRNGTEPAEHDIFITPKLITQENLDEAERIAEIQ